MTESVQDYLKVIYELASEGGNSVSTSAIAERMGVSAASVTGMIKRLSGMNPPLVYYRKHRGVSLSTEGESATLEVIRHHRLLETYLVEVLGYSWDQVHEEACKMEHVISEEFEKRIAEALGNPARDPHGHCIPSPDLTILKESDEPLSSLRPPAKAFVSRVQDRDSALLRYLKSVGLVPGTEVEAVAYSPFDENLGLRVAGNREPLFLGKAVSSRIHIKSGKAYAKRT